MSRTKPDPLVTDRRYKDAPRFQLIYAYEDRFKKQFNRHLDMMMVELGKTMMDVVKQTNNATIKKAIVNNDIEVSTRNIDGELVNYCRVRGSDKWNLLSSIQCSKLGL